MEYRINIQKPGNCATFIYTSGTTGPPKAVMISHDNYTWITDAIAYKIGLADPDKIGKNRIISLLPLSHVAAQLLDLVVSVRFGVSVYFADPSALQGNLVKFLLISKPYNFFNIEPFSYQFLEFGKKLKKGSLPLELKQQVLSVK